MPGPSRKELLASAFLTAATAGLPASVAASLRQGEEIGLEDLRVASKVAGVHFTDEELKEILGSVRDLRKGADELRATGLPNSLEMATRFVPLGGGSLPGKVGAKAERKSVTRDGLSDTDLAFLTVAELGALLRKREVSSRQLTELALARLKRFGPELHCVIHLLEERALAEADAADHDLSAGRDHGPLHGIPYGVKDLFAAKGAPTTWGAAPYKDQVFDFDAAVVEHLRKAGAILVAKLSNGALAMNDVWFGGMTRNPWNPQQGSSGSSAGSASAVAAGLVPFAIGTETLGSIVSPSIRCRTTGLRPTYGRVSRFGGMVLSQTMDKVGPIARTAEDAALVFAAIAGSDPRDPSSVDHPFAYPQKVDPKKLKIGYLVGDTKQSAKPRNAAIEWLEKTGFHLEPISFSQLPPGATDLLDAESAAFFDQLTRTAGEIAKLTNSEWPKIFRTARFMSAVDYINAQRARTRVMETFEREFGDFDAFICAAGGYTLAHVNLTGHPQIVVPLPDGSSVSFVGRLYREDVLCSLAWQLQKSLQAYRLRPKLTS